MKRPLFSLCCFVSSCVVLCRAMSRCAVWCGVVLCGVVLIVFAGAPVVARQVLLSLSLSRGVVAGGRRDGFSLRRILYFVCFVRTGTVLVHPKGRTIFRIGSIFQSRHKQERKGDGRASQP